MELRRRGVLKVATGYLIVSWLTLEIGHTLFNRFELPHAALKFVFVLLALGFPAVLFASWHGTFGGHGAEAGTAPGPAHEGSVHEGPWLAGVFGVVAIFAIAVAIAVRYFGMGPGAAHEAAPAGQEAAPAGTARAAAPAAEGDRSIAVLPFLDMSEASDQAYFADGMAEEILDLLAKVPTLKVIARTSSFQFKGKSQDVRDVGHSLGVANVLEGSVRKSGQRLRITTQLIRTSDGTHVWSETYDRELDDVFKVQDEIAGAVVQELKASLLGGAPPPASIGTSAQAYSLFLQARYLAARDTFEDVNKALALYTRVTELDPAYAPAWAGIAFCHGRRTANGVDTNGVGFEKQRAAAERAIALDPALASGYVTLATGILQFSRDWKKGAALVAKARELDPNNVEVLTITGHLARVTGRPEDAIGYFQQAIERDPLTLSTRRYLVSAYASAGRLADAEAEAQHALALDANYPALHYVLGRTLLAKGDRAGALAAFQAETSPAWREFGLPLGYRALGRSAEADAALAALLKNSAGSEFQVAETYAFFGDADKAFEWLGKARDLHDPGLIWVLKDPLLASLERDPRYGAFLKSLDLEVPVAGT